MVEALVVVVPDVVVGNGYIVVLVVLQPAQRAIQAAVIGNVLII